MADDLFSSLFPEGVLPAAQKEAEQVRPIQPYERVVWSVSKLLASVQDRLSIHFETLWVEGEVSNLRSPGSGHLYFTLKDDACQIRAVMFRGQASRLPFVLEDGQHLLCLGRVSIYRNRGDLQLIVDSAEPAGEGALRLAFDQLKERLSKEGLFDELHKKELPAFPERVFIITSPAGAALHDFVKTAKLRNRAVEIVVCPAKVQGKEAACDVTTALDLAQRASGPNDVIVIARGGGSFEDLWPFNDEDLARAIFECPVPIVSAIGHEVDFTISDFVADKRAATPTAAAQMVIPDMAAFKERFINLKSRLVDVMEGSVRKRRQHLAYLDSGIREPRAIIAERRLLADDLRNTLVNSIGKKLKYFVNTFNPLRVKLAANDPSKRVSGQRARLHTLNVTMFAHTRKIFENKKRDLALLAGQLHSLSPLNVLSRGYSVVYSLESGEIITKCSTVQVGDGVGVQLADGTLECEVKSIKRDGSKDETA